MIAPKTTDAAALPPAPFIAEVGARCPLGLNSLQIATAARAGKLEIRESRIEDKRRRWVGSARSRFLPEDLFGIERLVRLGAPALREAGASLASAVPLFVGAAEPERPDLGAELDAELIARLAAAGEVPVDAARSAVFRTGNAGFASALEAAVRALELGAPAAIAGSVDSFIHPAALAWLDEEHRLHAEGTEDGIVPSEGAAFALVLPRRALDPALFRVPGWIPPELARVRFARTARDESAIDPEGPMTAQVITELVQAAIVAAGTPPSLVVNDVDEHHRVREWSRVELRAGSTLDAAEHLRAPDVFGDAGAAIGALVAAYVCRGWAIGGAPRGTMLLALHADGAPRGAVILEEAR